MTICAVFNCNSNNKYIRSKGNSFRTQIKYFRFPKNNVLAKIWRQKCKRNEKHNFKNAFVCSKHFTSGDYRRNLRHELLQSSPKNCKKLKLNAIPTKNLPTPNAKSTCRQDRHQDKRNYKPKFREISESISSDEETAPPTKKCSEVATSTDSLSIDISEAMKCEIVELKERIMKLQNECHYLKKENDCFKKYLYAEIIANQE